MSKCNRCCQFLVHLYRNIPDPLTFVSILCKSMQDGIQLILHCSAEPFMAECQSPVAVFKTSFDFNYYLSQKMCSFKG